MRVGVIARLTFHEAARRWILWAALLLGLAFLTIFALGFREMESDISMQGGRGGRLVADEFRGFFLMAGLYVVNFLTVMMTVLTSVDTLAGEIASGTMQTVASKPLRRWEVLIGKWLGYIVMLSLYLLLMGGGVIVVTYALSGYLAPNILRGLGLMWLNIALLLSVSLAGGAMFSTLANGVLVFGLYGLAFIGGWVEQVGALVGNDNAVRIGVLCSLILPGEAMWKRAAFEMESPLVAAMGFSPFTSASVPSPAMVWYAVGYGLAVLALAVWQFSRRDL